MLDDRLELLRLPDGLRAMQEYAVAARLEALKGTLHVFWGNNRALLLALKFHGSLEAFKTGITEIEDENGKTPEDIAIESSSTARLRTAVAGLPKRRRMVVARLLAGASLQEAASHAAVCISRARRVRSEAYAVLRWELRVA